MIQNDSNQTILTDKFTVFCNGTDTFKNITDNGVQKHKTGLFILAPSGSGKSYFVERQEEMHWIDGDMLWPLTGADETDESWSYDLAKVLEINARCDTITIQAKRSGLWVVGSSNLFLVPDAIVLPPWDVHQNYVATREIDDTTHGATSSDLKALQEHRDWISQWENYGVPCFESIVDATKYCEKIPATSYHIIGRA